jgi:Flp pilus assembly protein TadG
MTFPFSSRLRQLHADERGEQLIEFAVSLSLLMMVISSIMYMSVALYADHYVSDAARQATRYAMVRGSSWTTTTCTTTSTFSCNATAANVTSYVKSITPSSIAATGLTITTTWPGTTASGADCSASNVNNTPGCVVTVQVSYAFNFLLPFIPKKALALTSTSSMVVLQ